MTLTQYGLVVWYAEDIRFPNPESYWHGGLFECGEGIELGRWPRKS